MFFKRKHLIELGYKVMGIDFGNEDTYNNYVKYFDKYNSMVVFSSIHSNSIMVYRLTPEQYKDFHKGKYALSNNGNGEGKTPTGYEIKNYGYINVFSGGELKNRKTLKIYLDAAEKIAQSNNKVVQIGVLLS